MVADRVNRRARRRGNAGTRHRRAGPRCTGDCRGSASCRERRQDRPGLENRCGPFGPPRVRIPPPPLIEPNSLQTSGFGRPQRAGSRTATDRHGRLTSGAHWRASGARHSGEDRAAAACSGTCCSQEQRPLFLHRQQRLGSRSAAPRRTVSDPCRQLVYGLGPSSSRSGDEDLRGVAVTGQDVDVGVADCVAGARVEVLEIDGEHVLGKLAA
jgi:hypothetical protein